MQPRNANFLSLDWESAAIADLSIYNLCPVQVIHISSYSKSVLTDWTVLSSIPKLQMAEKSKEKKHEESDKVFVHQI